MTRTTYNIEPTPETALLVGVELKGAVSLWRLEDSLAELERLAETAGLDVVGTLTQRIDRPNPATLIGSGKVEELVALRADTGAQVIIFDEELSPAQQRELERALGNPDIKVLDRTALILDIFAQHAHTREGALQVELAQYEYRLPRLTRAWTIWRGREAGRRGAGARAVWVCAGQAKLSSRSIDGRSGAASRTSSASWKRCVRSGPSTGGGASRKAISVVALVGYTNAGKSTLLNALSGAGVYAADQLFATLDPTTRRVTLPGGREVLFTDTVGFIQKLPTMLVASFRATLEEIAEADLLLHVVDITHASAQEQATTVLQVLKDLDAGDQPIVTALNKIDGLPAEERMAGTRAGGGEHMVAVSALTGEGLPDLLTEIEEILTEDLVRLTVLLPYQRGDLLGLFHQRGVIDREDHMPEGTRCDRTAAFAHRARFTPFALAHSRP